MTQYPLSLSFPAVYAEENFVLSKCNREAHDFVMRWPDWPSYALILTGDAGCGKTHLGHVWAQKSGALIASAKSIPEPLACHALIESIDEADETTLFHTLNFARENNFSLLLTLQRATKDWPFHLPDLTSRLRALPQVMISPPDDEALAAVIRKQFSDRQLKVEEDVIAYLMLRIERSFPAAKMLVETLDAAAMAEKKNITVPFVRQHLPG
jgi:chromosomal replication initiation ATPase DnaA